MSEELLLQTFETLLHLVLGLIAIDLILGFIEAIILFVRAFKLYKMGFNFREMSQEEFNNIMDAMANGSYKVVPAEQTTSIIPCQIVHKIRGQERAELIVLVNKVEQSVEIPEVDYDTYQIGDTIDIVLETIITEEANKIVQESYHICEKVDKYVKFEQEMMEANEAD